MRLIKQIRGGAGLRCSLWEWMLCVSVVLVRLSGGLKADDSYPVLRGLCDEVTKVPVMLKDGQAERESKLKEIRSRHIAALTNGNKEDRSEALVEYRRLLMSKDYNALLLRGVIGEMEKVLLEVDGPALFVTVREVASDTKVSDRMRARAVRRLGRGHWLAWDSVRIKELCLGLFGDLSGEPAFGNRRVLGKATDILARTPVWDAMSREERTKMASLCTYFNLHPASEPVHLADLAFKADLIPRDTYAKWLQRQLKGVLLPPGLRLKVWERLATTGGLGDEELAVARRELDKIIATTVERKLEFYRKSGVELTDEMKLEFVEGAVEQYDLSVDSKKKLCALYGAH